MSVYQHAKSWPFEEARRLADRLQGKPALFQTGYGPSGLPHIGTFAEVARTSWVRRAYETLTGQSTRLIAFSDDMDGLRQVPQNVPQRELLESYIGYPLSKVPDPFGEHDSFSAHNNAKLQRFLDQFGFSYEFYSATHAYQSGQFNAALLQMLRKHDEICAVIHPTLGMERRATYSPFMPLHPETGKVMQVAIEAIDVHQGLLTWRDPDTKTLYETSIFDGKCKAQWKADWALRWYALGVDYEMSGKDLIDSVRLSSQICKILGGTPPVQLTYELFLDENGEKISKSKGNGVSLEEWLNYGPQESLEHFLFINPKAAKKIYTRLIPKLTDDAMAGIEKLASLPEEKACDTPAWHIAKTDSVSPVSYALLLNLANVANSDDPNVVWGFVQRYRPDTDAQDPWLQRLIPQALRYYRDFVQPQKHVRRPSAAEQVMLQDLYDTLHAMPEGSAEDFQREIYEVGKRHYDTTQLRGFFGALYEILLGQTEGPRFGHFVAIYGWQNTLDLLQTALDRQQSV